MALLTITNQANIDAKPAISPSQAGVVIADRRTTAIAAAATGITATEIVLIGFLPAGCLPESAEIVSADLDSNGTPTAEYDVIICESGVEEADVDTSLFADVAAATECTLISGASSTIFEAGGSDEMSLAEKITAQADGPYDEDRYIGLIRRSAAATGAAGNVTLTLKYFAV